MVIKYDGMVRKREEDELRERPRSGWEYNIKTVVK
jgi:hypothetical protein